MAKKKSGSSVLRKLFENNVEWEIPLDEINELCIHMDSITEIA